MENERKKQDMPEGKGFANLTDDELSGVTGGAELLSRQKEAFTKYVMKCGITAEEAGGILQYKESHNCTEEEARCKYLKLM